jgi:hypothetical protein
VTSHRRRSWLVAAPLGSNDSLGGAAAWEIWPAVAAWHGGGASQRSRQWSGCGRRGTWTAAGGAGRRGRGARPRHGSGPVGPDLGWPGPALACFKGFRGSPPPAMVWLGHRIRAGVPRSGSRRRPLLGSVGLTCWCVLLVVPHCPSPGLLALFSPAILLDISSWCFAVTWV